MDCPECGSKMNSLCKMDLDDILLMMKDKMVTGEFKSPSEDKVTGYVCMECGNRYKKEEV